MSVLGEQVAPDYNMPVLDIGETRIDVFFLRIGLGRREQAVEVRRVRLVLPVMLERVYVDLPDVPLRLWGLERRRHVSISPERAVFAPATLESGSMSYVTEPSRRR
jgi:hypothetical protein